MPQSSGRGWLLSYLRNVEKIWRCVNFVDSERCAWQNTASMQPKTDLPKFGLGPAYPRPNPGSKKQLWKPSCRSPTMQSCRSPCRRSCLHQHLLVWGCKSRIFSKHHLRVVRLSAPPQFSSLRSTAALPSEPTCVEMIMYHARTGYRKT